MREYLRARTAFFDRAVVSALGAGIRQVVVGAAGYDGRALRYGGTGARWFEVDHPDTQADKVQRLDRLGLGTDHAAFVAADFTADPAGQRLLAAGLDPEARALFLFEGIAVYLDDAVTESVLRQFREVTPDGSPLAISLSTSAGSGDESRQRFRERFRERVASVGEPARSALTAGQGRELLARAGWEPRPDSRRAQAAGLLIAHAV